MTWTDERRALCVRLWDEGLSATQISARINGSGVSVSRNAVLGILFRMGKTKGRRTVANEKQKRKASNVISFASRHPRAAAPARAAPSQPLPIEPYIAHEELDIPLAERKSLLDLGERDCRWPIGDPQSSDFHFCGRTKFGGLFYCEHHARRAYQVAEPKARKPRATTVEPVETPVPALEREVEHA